jgi:hypothetical protein
MAVWIYIEENGSERSELIPPGRLQAHLDAGWSIESRAMRVEKADAEEVEAPTKEEADTNNSGKLSSEEVRAAAEKAGIEGWETKRIKTLKKELGYDDQD